MGAPIQAHGMTNANELLVAYDRTDAGRRAAEFAADRAAKTGESVDVVHVGTDVTEDDVRDQLGSIFAEQGVEASFTVVEVGGSEDRNVSVSAVLSDVIDDNDYELVVLGNEERGLFDELTAGSVSKDIIEDGIVPVVLVP